MAPAKGGWPPIGKFGPEYGKEWPLRRAGGNHTGCFGVVSVVWHHVRVVSSVSRCRAMTRFLGSASRSLRVQHFSFPHFEPNRGR
jgi:hypothetical protein